MTSSEAPMPSGSTASQRRLAHRSLAYMMIVTFRERTDERLSAQNVSRSPTVHSPVRLDRRELSVIVQCLTVLVISGPCQPSAGLVIRKNSATDPEMSPNDNALQACGHNSEHVDYRIADLQHRAWR